MNNFTDIYPFSDREVPKQWLHCFNTQCSLHDRCLRYITGLRLDYHTTQGFAVYPTASTLTPCPHYKEARIIRAAWGFDRLFTDVKARDGKTIRDTLKRMLGGHGSYYAYHHGVMVLTPELQEAILHLFQRWGYTENLTFDGYDTRVDFS